MMSFRMSDMSRLLEVRKYIDENDHGIERFTGEQSRDRTRRVTSSTHRRRRYATVVTSVNFVYIYAHFHYFSIL